MTKELPQHQDILGNDLAVGDIVAFSSHNSLAMGIVDKLNQKMIGLKRVNTRWRQNKYPRDCVKVDENMGLLYLLKNGDSR
jgi:hypothetical protein